MVGMAAVGGIVVTAGMAITGVAIVIGTVVVEATAIGMIGDAAIAINEHPSIQILS